MLFPCKSDANITGIPQASWSLRRDRKYAADDAGDQQLEENWRIALVLHNFPAPLQ